MTSSGRNQAYLPESPFPNGITATADLSEAVGEVDGVLITVPSHAFAGLVEALRDKLAAGVPIAWATKGLGPAGLLGASVSAALPDHPQAVLSGPSFASEVAAGLPTAVALAATDREVGEQLGEAFQGPRFRVYPGTDLIGVQVGGAVKNVIAIATGIADALGLGANARSGVITRGLAEMRRLGRAMGADDATFSGLAGTGDLVLTCTDDQSRNRRHGLALGGGQPHKLARETVEGSDTAARVLALADMHGVEMPITDRVAEVVHGRATPAQAAEDLMQRGMRREGE
jgi:glycerol-3-phosphate dehydrogenase (NAD(P)+)